MKVTPTKLEKRPVPPVTIVLDPEEAAILVLVMNGNSTDSDQKAYRTGCAQPEAVVLLDRLGWIPSVDVATGFHGQAVPRVAGGAPMKMHLLSDGTTIMEPA